MTVSGKPGKKIDPAALNRHPLARLSLRTALRVLISITEVVPFLHHQTGKYLLAPTEARQHALGLSWDLGWSKLLYILGSLQPAECTALDQKNQRSVREKITLILKVFCTSNWPCYLLVFLPAIYAYVWPQDWVSYMCCWSKHKTEFKSVWETLIDVKSLEMWMILVWSAF